MNYKEVPVEELKQIIKRGLNEAWKREDLLLNINARVIAELLSVLLPVEEIPASSPPEVAVKDGFEKILENDISVYQKNICDGIYSEAQAIAAEVVIKTLQNVLSEYQKLSTPKCKVTEGSIVEAFIKKLGNGGDKDHAYMLSWEGGEWWITHKTVGSGEPLMQMFEKLFSVKKQITDEDVRKEALWRFTDGHGVEDHHSIEVFVGAIKWYKSRISSPLNTNEEKEVEHKCRYCGVMTTQPDDQCYKAPEKEVDAVRQPIIEFNILPMENNISASDGKAILMLSSRDYKAYVNSMQSLSAKEKGKTNEN